MSQMCWSKPSRSKRLNAQTEPPQGQGIHVFLLWTKDGEKYFSHTSGEVTAEELCITAAQAVGIIPLCHVLFGLYNPLSRCWYSPNHVFSLEEDSSLVLHYCMRFYFHNWHGLNEKEPVVSRHRIRSGTDQGGFPLFDLTSLEYLFAQAKYEFVNEVLPFEDIQSEKELSRFRNESLGMAVLHLSHLAVQKGCTLQEVAGKVSFQQCIPKSFSRHISKDNILTRVRIKRVFANFVQTFQQHTMDNGRFGSQHIMYKYIATLENLVPQFGTETFPVTHLEITKDGDGGGAYVNGTRLQGDSKDGNPVTHEILVSGTKGILWREVPVRKVQSNDYQRKDQPNVKTSSELSTFCDFPEVTHISLSGANVCISTQDTNSLVVEMNSSQEARSFISLLDGYYRLTADAHHFLCHEVAPPRVVLSEANGLHGPMHDDFVLLKLKKEAAEEGVFLLRWSSLDHHRIILAVLKKNNDGATLSHKQFRIQYKEGRFRLEGWDQEYSSMKELTENLKSFVLKSGPDSFTLKKCSLPRHAEHSNLLVMRKGYQPPVPPPELHINPIKDKKIIQGKHLGCGTRTNIYSGHLLVQEQGDNNKDGDSNNKSNDSKRIQVVLKILDKQYNDIALTFFESASLMSQVSHRHLVFVHGVSVRGAEQIMVEEFVEFGPLDVFLRKEKAAVTPQWKFIVAKQLASALSYLETKRMVHGNVCGKNILVARRGLEPGTTPFIKLSDPGIALSVLTRDERLDRIPWIAPECVDSGALVSNTADQWSFGITLLEICNNGDLPLSRSSLSNKEEFYKQKGQLAIPSSQDLASFISRCLNYEPTERPSFPTVLRELPENPDITPGQTLPEIDPNVFHKRYMREIRSLGMGHFGKVTLYQYDPFNDGTGECVAVKSLKQDNGHTPESWIKEIEILKSLNHCNIVKYRGCCYELGGQVVQLIMEYLPQKSLRDYLPTHKVGVPQCLMFAQQICEGMEYLQSKRYIHRDLAARNVLVDNSSLVKIGDFGLSKSIPEGQLYYCAHNDGDSPVYWYAIECLKESKFSFSSDIWSFGVTLYEIFTRCDPKQSPPTKYIEMTKPQDMTLMVLINLLERNQRLPCPSDCPHEVRRLMEECWALKPADRPTFQSLIERFGALRQMYNWQIP